MYVSNPVFYRNLCAFRLLRSNFCGPQLQRAIESYREKHQGPVLSRAGELFSTLTLGDHRGLTTAFGDDDKPVLVAIRKSGEHVEVEGLSDGTRDQLYLALRLAAIEHHVKSVAPCPVILDDILKCTQVLFFRHHKHLAELSAKANAQIIELNTSDVATFA